MEVAHLIQGDGSQLGESGFFCIGNIASHLLEESFLPLFLFYEVFAQFLAAGAAIFDVDIARAELLHVVALMHNITPQDTLTTMALQAGLHSVVTSVPLHAAPILESA